MIEVYVDNHDDPTQVENTVKEFSDRIEHAENITCITVHESKVPLIEKLQLDILYKRGRQCLLLVK